MKITRSSISFLFSILAVSMLTVGCGSLGKKVKNFFAGDEKKPVAQNTQMPSDQPDVMEKDNMGQVPQRQYGRMTRARMEQEAQLQPRAGSLWVMEGQGAYLFSENNFRLNGDLLNVKLEGAPKEQLQTKAKIIRDLLKKIDRAARAPAANGNGKKDAAAPAAAPADGAGGAAPGADGAGAQAAGGPGAPGASQDDADGAGGDEKVMPIEVVPTRVVERLSDGNYRVEGSQSFMIGKREYRVLVAGIVRAQDFNDEGVAAPRLMDPKFDIVSTKKGGK